MPGFEQQENIVLPEFRVLSGDRIQLPCNITFPTNGDSISLILWYKNDWGNGPIYSVDNRQTESRHFVHNDITNRAYLNISARTLTIDPVKSEDEGEYRCRVDYRWARTVNTLMNLVVIVPPRKVIIRNEQMEAIEDVAGPYQEDTTIKLICEAKGARPPAKVHWYHHNQLIDGTSYVVQEGTRVRNELTIGPLTRSHLFAVHRCQAFNTNQTHAIEASVMLDINFRPISVQILNDYIQPLISGRSVEIMCQSVGSRPAARIMWFKNDKQIMSSREYYSDDNNVTKSVLTMTPVPDDNGARLVCLADNVKITNSSIENILTLDVHFEPRASLVMTTSPKNSVVAEGNDVHMDCKTKSNPPSLEFSWFYDQRIIKTELNYGIFITNSTLNIRNVSRKHEGKYYCLATNSVGRGKSNDFILSIDYAPICKSGQKIVYGVGLDETARILCDVDARPSHVTYQWTFNDTIDPTLKFYSEGLRSVLLYTPKSRHDFGYLSCRGTNVAGIQQSPCVYTVIPAGKPEAVVNCETHNIGFTSLTISCSPGYDGGLQQTFALEVFQKSDDKLVLNLTNSLVTTFELSALQHNTDYKIKVYANNVKGKSEPFTTWAKTNSPPVSTPEISAKTDESNGVTEKIVIIAVILALIAILLVVFCKILRKLKQKVGESDDEDNVDDDNKSEETGDYTAGDDIHSQLKSYHNLNGSATRNDNYSNSLPAATNYINEVNNRERSNQDCYQIYEVQLQEDLNDFYHQNDCIYINRDVNSPMMSEPGVHWSPNVSTKSSCLEMSYPSMDTNTLGRYHNSNNYNQYFYSNTIAGNRNAHRKRTQSYTSTPV
ncbi:hemicentin-1-like [Oppia nitens]|uniref:hemicentin-1-like n=1 Tax=Oppia nitens TaxID=1686743 RepID=UPI0023D97E6D|nr:hemicentin-1-like [Oppia nitens]